MSIETETLKTLERIEKLLEQSMVSAKPDATTRRRVNIAGQKKSEQPDFDDLNTSIFKATKGIDRLTGAADKAADSMKRARGDIISLRTGIRSAAGSTSAALSSLNTAVETVVNSMSMAEMVPEDKRKEVSGGFTALGNASAIVRLQFGMLSKSAKTLTEALEKAAGVVLKDVVPADGDRVKSTEGVTAATVAQTDAVEDNVNKQTKAGGFFSGMLSRMGITMQDVGDRGEWLKNQLSNLGWTLSDALINVIKDVYHLQSRGIQAGDSLFSLYGKAIMAGMSLEEYTSMLQDNQAAVVRARSFDDFAADINKATRQLNKLGVFGPAAEQLAASMKTNAVSLGVPMAQQEDMIAGQIKVFEQLRKSTLLTADGFKQLMVDISDNQQVQEQLLGLAPQERAARLQQIAQMSTIGYQLGATAKASEALKDAILAQRGATVKDRFKAAGSIRMGGAILGMNTANVEEYARIMMKNPAARSKEETVRMTELAGEYKQFLEALKNSPNPALENIADQLREIQPEVQSSIQNAAGAVKQQTESGSVANTDIGKSTTPLQQEIGQALTVLSGIMKNPLAEAGVIFTSILGQSLMQNFWLARIAKNTDPNAKLLSATPKGKGKPDPMGPSKPSFTAQPGKRLVIEKNRMMAQSPVVNGVKGIFSSIADVVKGGSRMISGYVSGIRGTVSLLGPTLTIIGEIGIAASRGWEMLKAAAVGIKNIFVKGGPIGMAFGFIEELFTGEATKFLALGDGLGARLLGAAIAGFNSFFTGITRLVDDGINWVMEGLGLSFRSNITKLFDIATSYLTDGVKLVLAGLVKTLAASLEYFGFKDAPWVKSLKETEQGLYKSIEESSANREKLMQTEGATMRSLGEQQVKAQQAAADKSKKLIATTNDNVVFSLDNLAASAQRSVNAAQVDNKTVAAAPAPTQGTQVAMPGPTKQPSVTPPEVNKTQVADAGKRSEDAAKAKEVLGPDAAKDEAILVMKQQLQVMQQMLAYWTNQEDLSEALLKAGNRPGLQSNEKLYAAALRGSRA